MFCNKALLKQDHAVCFWLQLEYCSSLAASSMKRCSFGGILEMYGTSLDYGQLVVNVPCLAKKKEERN